MRFFFTILVFFNPSTTHPFQPKSLAYRATQYATSKQQLAIPDKIYINRAHCASKNYPVPSLWIINSLPCKKTRSPHILMACLSK